MTITHYDPSSTLREARARYFEVNAFGDDGGYADAWVDFKLGPIPIPFPNTRSRVRAVGYHDLHHILTGYDTNATGEFEISAWELGAGCKDFFAAWQLNLGGFAAGLVSSPVRTVRAFLRGRASNTLYGLPLESLLDRTVGEARNQFVDLRPPRLGAGDVVRLAACTAGGIVATAFFVAAFFPLVPFGLATMAVRAAKKSAPRASA